MQIKATTADAYRLIHDGLLALADVEETGIHVDVDYCEEQLEKVTEETERIEANLLEHREVRYWKKRFGKSFNLKSDDQLRYVLFDKFEYEPVKYTEKGGDPALDAEALSALGLKFGEDFLRWRRLEKTKNTYLKNLIQETHDGIVHPFFNLDKVRTFRSSSDKPNFQNLPIRDPEMGKIIRRAILPRPGNRLLEIDYGGIEVKGSTWYHCDPVMLEYLWNPDEKSMHFDMALQLYKLEDLNKSVKSEKNFYQGAKNGFVFPQFYGDYYGNNAVSLLEWAKIAGYDDKSGLQHLADKKLVKLDKRGNVRDMNAFVEHVKQVEDDFWNNRFRVYKKWREQIVKDYNKTGIVKLLTGFECKGVMKKNNVINYPIQGVSFHALLWSLIRLNKLIKREGWEARIIGQIHDSIIVDLPTHEVRKFLVMAERVMCHEIKTAWPFINTPMEIEADMTPVNGSWDSKKEITLPKAA